jgi:hypothetical protein
MEAAAATGDRTPRGILSLPTELIDKIAGMLHEHLFAISMNVMGTRARGSSFSNVPTAKPKSQESFMICTTRPELRNCIPEKQDRSRHQLREV